MAPTYDTDLYSPTDPYKNKNNINELSDKYTRLYKWPTFKKLKYLSGMFGFGVILGKKLSEISICFSNAILDFIDRSRPKNESKNKINKI